VVLDTSVVASAFRSRNGASYLLLRAVAQHRLTMVATPPLFLEYEEVLKRADQLDASGLSIREVDEALAALAALVEPVEVRFVWRPQLRDTGDELVLEAAVNGRVDALVTHNVRDFVEAAPRFGLRIARPAELVNLVK
jgi:putative PIN family toxin of toxin-antitoxin system